MKSLWEEMELKYIKGGVMSINEIKKSRERMVENLNLCQADFITFLERPCEKQQRINEFVTSLNKFSEEFPDLRKDEQTKEELLNRLQQLSNTLWAITEQRKDESINQIEQMKTGGWADQQMKQLVRNMASLIEIEIGKFEVVYKLQMQQEPPAELDAEIVTKKLLTRGVPTFDSET